MGEAGEAASAFDMRVEGRDSTEDAGSSEFIPKRGGFISMGEREGKSLPCRFSLDGGSIQ